MEDDIKFICEDEWRKKRLQKSLKIACDMLGITEDQAATLIESIQDERGMLAVSWRHQWTRRQEEAFSVAWGLCGEKPAAVVHVHPRHLMTGEA